MKGLHMVLVRWVDSMASHGWHDFKKSNIECQSCGFLFKEYKDRIVIFQSANKYQNAEYLEIPRSAILKIIKLEGMKG